MRYCLEFWPEPNTLSIGVDKMISPQILNYCCPDCKCNGEFEPHHPVVQELFLVDGIVWVGLNPYEVCVEKGSVFHWSEVMPGILYAIGGFDTNSRLVQSRLPRKIAVDRHGRMVYNTIKHIPRG